MFDFVEPITQEFYNECITRNPNLPNNVAFFGLDTTEIEPYKIALVGVEDNLNNDDNQGTELAPNQVRQQLYTYTSFYNDTKIIDLGNIKKGNTRQDTLVALKDVTKNAIRNNIILIIIGGDLDLLQAQYNAYEILENEIQISQIGANMTANPEEGKLEESYLYSIFNTNYLKKYNLIAYQSYFIQKDISTIVHNYQFDSLRVGKIRENVFEAEPFIREANLAVFDIQAIRFSDAPGQVAPSPNGLFGDEACMLARFAGMSDILSSFGIYNYNPMEDIKNVTAHQVAQMIWYFIEGVNLRRMDYPILNEQEFYHFTVYVEEEAFTFLKSKKTERWWMKINVNRGERIVAHLIPCIYNDYRIAKDGEIPEAWMRNLIRLQ